MKSNSFTLVEILVVVAIVGILSGFIFYTVQNNVSKANIAKSQVFSESIRNNLLLNLVSEWKLDNNANDAWGTNNGTDTNVTYLSSSQCISGQCGSFNGTSSYIRIPDTTAFNFGSQMSAFVWVKGGDIETTQFIFNQWQDGLGEASWLLYNILAHPGKLRVALSDDGSWSAGHRKAYYISAVMLDGSWHFVGFTWNNGELKLYIDGVEAETIKELDDTFTSIYNSSSALMIGCGLNVSSNPLYPFNGSIDEVQIYNAALSSSQIKQNYLSGLNNLLSQGLISESEYNERISTLQ